MLTFARFSTALVAASFLALAACSSSSSGAPNDPSNGGGGGDDTDAGADANPIANPSPPVGGAAFASFCTGTLLNDEFLMTQAGPDQWQGDGSQSAPAGSAFLVAVSFDKFGGFVLDGKGTASEIDSLSGFVEGTDFVSNCAPATPPPASNQEVVLQKISLYTTEALSGTPCTIAAGTVLSTHSNFPNSSGVSQVNAPEFSKCGAGPFYTRQLALGALIAK